MTEDLERLRQRLKAALPSSIGAAAESYQRFTADDPPADAKGFAAWHAAAKAALGHMEVLVKLARWAEGGGEAGLSEDGPAGLDRLLAEARAALGRFDGEEDED